MASTQELLKFTMDFIIEKDMEDEYLLFMNKRV